MPDSPKDWSPHDRHKKTYHVTVREVHFQTHEVKASSKEEAKEIVGDGGGQPVDGTFEFSHTLDTDTWLVEEVKEKAP